MSIKQRQPEFLLPENNGEHIVKIPYVATSGASSSPYAYNNALHAALHSVLAAMKCGHERDILLWIKDASRQLADAQNALNKRGARVVPAA